MPFPQGGDFVQAVDRDLNIVASDSSARTATSRITSAGEIPFAFLLPVLSSTLVGSYLAFQAQSSVVRTYNINRVVGTIASLALLYKVPGTRDFSGNVVGVPSTVSSFWRMVQFDSGRLPRFEDIFSDLFVYDVVSAWNYINRVSIEALDATTPSIFSVGILGSFKNVVSTDYYTTISGEVDPCIGDNTPPYITLHSPSVSGSHLRPRTQIVDFSLTDAVGGVDISTVSVNVTSNSTSGTINIVQNGIDQTGGYVSIAGTITTYRFIYAPPFEWDYNERVLVSISGSDLPPTVDGNPFYCGVPSINTFIGDIPFQVLDFRELSAEITVVGDTEPPFISSTFPVSGTLNNSVFTDVSFVLEDALAGVDISSVDVTVAGAPIISAGVPVTDEATIVGTTTSYTVSYDPLGSFNYGSNVVVEIVAKDRAKPTANTLSTSFSFSCIDDSSLVISNFQPAVGTHTNPENLDVMVDVTDATYGVDSDQTFLVVNGTIVSGTRVAITDGYRITYHPQMILLLMNLCVLRFMGPITIPWPLLLKSRFTLYFMVAGFYSLIKSPITMQTV